jgi:hypothetical protein
MKSNLNWKAHRNETHSIDWEENRSKKTKKILFDHINKQYSLWKYFSHSLEKDQSLFPFVIDYICFSFINTEKSISLLPIFTNISTHKQNKEILIDIERKVFIDWLLNNGSIWNEKFQFENQFFNLQKRKKRNNSSSTLLSRFLSKMNNSIVKKEFICLMFSNRFFIDSFKRTLTLNMWKLLNRINIHWSDRLF